MSFFDKLRARCCGKPDTEPGQRTMDRIGTSAALSDVWFQESKTEKLGENTMNSFNNDQAAKLRNAIQSTTSALAVLTASSALQTVLQTHLAELLVRERALFGCDTEPKPVAKDTPWYPDDSGKWVEVPPGAHDVPAGLDPNAQVEVLTRGERRIKRYGPVARPAETWSWKRGEFVAYKIVAPVAKATPWYPDNSGKWVEVPPGTRALPPGLDPKCLSEVLSSTERRTKTYFGRAYPSKDWGWPGGHIVAYKIVD